MHASLILVSILFLHSEPGEQQNAASQPSGNVRKIVALQGEGAINNIKAGIATEPVVEVRDDRDLPVAGVEVTFQLPTSGAGGFFPGRSSTVRTRTNENGQAAGTGLTPNNVSGPFRIRVTATSGTATANLVINERNVADAAEAARLTGAHSQSLKWKIIAIAGGAAVTVGVLFATHTIGVGGGSPSNTLTVAPGPITIGSPH